MKTCIDDWLDSTNSELSRFIRDDDMGKPLDTNTFKKSIDKRHNHKGPLLSPSNKSPVLN